MYPAHTITNIIMDGNIVHDVENSIKVNSTGK
jgi:hypothetical protein